MPQRHLDPVAVAAVAETLRAVPKAQRYATARAGGASDRVARAARAQLLAEEGVPPATPHVVARATGEATTRATDSAEGLLAVDRRVLRALAAAPLASRALRAVTGAAPRTLSRAKARLVGLGLVRNEGSGPGSRWALTDAGRAAPTAEPPSPTVAPRGRAIHGDTVALRQAIEHLAAEVTALRLAIESHPAPRPCRDSMHSHHAEP